MAHTIRHPYFNQLKRVEKHSRKLFFNRFSGKGVMRLVTWCRKMAAQKKLCYTSRFKEKTEISSLGLNAFKEWSRKDDRSIISHIPLEAVLVCAWPLSHRYISRWGREEKQKIVIYIRFLFSHGHLPTTRTSPTKENTQGSHTQSWWIINTFDNLWSAPFWLYPPSFVMFRLLVRRPFGQM